MGRGSQIFWFLNAEELPTEEDIVFYYTHLYVDNELKKLRTEYRRNLMKELKKKKDEVRDSQERIF